ncbi:MAG TPA: DUF5698 domain-containing protein [Ignavibacteriaceae bacterium]|nr:DUF5698 domain-containing protein [Ignavibacteriaceae bacterium]
MVEIILGALLIMFMRICDVSIGTMRTLLVVQGRKYRAAMTGFFEVMIWILAIRFIMQHLDNIVNLFGYATGFAIGNIVGITIEQKIGLGHIQMNVISRHHSAEIAELLRENKFGVTVLPGEGGTGSVAVIMIITQRKLQRQAIKLIESVDSNAFITIQGSIPYRGFIQRLRK